MDKKIKKIQAGGKNEVLICSATVT